MIDELIKIYERDLDRLKLEIASFQNEDNLWEIRGNIINSAGNLCLHLVGNLNTYIGKNIGGYAYVRDRDAEFSLKNMPRENLLQQVTEVKETVLSSLKRMEKESLEEMHIENALGYPMTNSFFLIHLAAHFSYHLGQINYIRRVLE
jgi:uncharacterized damage-inducible protein DinB